MFKFLKIVKKLFIFLIVFLFIFFILSRGPVYDADELEYGVTFSAKQARDLGLEPKIVFEEMLYDLGVRNLRLSAYWNEIEPEDNGELLWDDMDWEIKKASEVDTKIILAVGGRLPRWPECHFPEWAKNMEVQDREKRVLDYIEKVINRYKDNNNIIAWQIENEPFLSHFGDCPELDSSFLDKEIALARYLDDRPIIVTDSGELSVWAFAAKRADIFGTTMYRDTYSELLNRYIHYPIGPSFFKFKKNIARLFAKPDKWIVIELQGEPWAPKPFQYVSKEEREKTMNLEKFRDIIDFSHKAGFKEFYLWGIEWWYWEKETQGNPALWYEAKKLF